MRQRAIGLVGRETIIRGPTRVICSQAIRELCRRPYLRHPFGCPNYGKRKNCPPRAGFFLEFFEEQVYVAAIRFNFEDYLAMRRQEHPKWTEKAIRNPRHWQGHVKSELKKFIAEELKNGHRDSIVIFDPEAMGVNVTQTCREVGLKLEWPPKKFVFQVALICKTRSSG